MDDADLPALREAIRYTHGCNSMWMESVPVREMFSGEVVWEGEVQVFGLIGHPAASRCYDWSHATEGSRRRPTLAPRRLRPRSRARVDAQAKKG